MSMFYACNPYISSGRPNIIEFILTCSDADSIALGTKDFMQEILHDIGVEGEVKEWILKPYRSKYYSDYVGREYWQDNWQLVWGAQVETMDKLRLLPQQRTPCVGTNAVDSTWLFATALDDNAAVGCLVISDFDSASEMEEAKQTIDEAIDCGNLKEFREKYSRRSPIFNCLDILGKYKQIQIDLGKFPGSFFAQGADYAEEVMELCRKMNGTVNFRDRV